MSEFLYVSDLRQMKYAILTSTRHDRVVRELAARLNMNIQSMRRCLIERLDMIHLENLPARYEAFGNLSREETLRGNALKDGLYTVYIPVLGEEDRVDILERLAEMEKYDMPVDQIRDEETRMIREAICS
jgi:energy-converting hydrogenase A subunit M